MGYVAKKLSVRNGSAMYYAVYNGPNGKRKWEAGGKLKKNAEALLQRREREVAEGTYGKQEDISFKDFADKWITDYATHCLKEKSLRDYQAIIRNHLVPCFRRQLLSHIDTGKIQRLVTEKMEAGLAPSTVIKIIVVLKMMLKHGQVWGFIKENPARFVQRPRQRRQEMDFLRPDEIRRFLDAVSPDHYALFATAILTGARQGEIMGLRWADVDLQGARLHIRRTYLEGRYTEPKSARSHRTVSLSPFLATVLRTHKAQSDADPDAPVFTNSLSGPIDAPNLVRREFLPALKRAGLRRIRFHDLRHTFGALMVATGENLKLVQTEMGHASITTTVDRYGHLLSQVSEGVGARLDSTVFGEDVVPITSARIGDLAKIGRI